MNNATFNETKVSISVYMCVWEREEIYHRHGNSPDASTNYPKRFFFLL